ncbi:MAG: hypothetical protein ACOX63_03785 [Christensenellales bacterium]|jgi:hypothetical protein
MIRLSENRSRYSSAPLKDIKKRAKRRSQAPQPPRRVGDYHDEQRSGSSFVVLQILLTIALPVLFIVSLLVRTAELYIAFAIASSLSLMAMWLLNAFVPNARTTLTVLHIAMILVALFAVWISAPAAPQPDTQGAQDITSGIYAANSEASLVNMARQQEAAKEPEATIDPGAKSQVQQRLEQFISAWIAQDYPGMVNYALPSWVQAQDNAEREMFKIRSNRSPVEYKVVDVLGTDADRTRTVEMDMLIDKSNGQPPIPYHFQVLMMRVNDVWYVDPNSLTSPQQIQQQAEAAPVITLAPMVTANPDMLLFYNADGGEFYHCDANCRSINAKYLPLTASFYYREINTEKYRNLKPCVTCHAPSR